MSFSPFEILGIPLRYDIDLKLLDQNYRNRMMLYHPDRMISKGEKEAASKQTQIINEAYQQLKSPLKRIQSIMQALCISESPVDPLFLNWILDQESKESYRKAWKDCENQLSEALLKKDFDLIAQIYSRMTYLYNHI